MEKDMTIETCLMKQVVKKKLRTGENIRIVDARSPEEFLEKHIPEVINIPLAALEISIQAFDPSRPVVKVVADRPQAQRYCET